MSRVWVGEQSGEEREERTPDRNSGDREEPGKFYRD